MSARRIGWIALQVFAFVLVLGGVVLVTAPIFMHPEAYGVHDWDQMQGHRYLAVKTIKRFHQFPFWNPYSCGGHTWWGGLESGTNIVSLWLPAYLLLSMTAALRVEVVGTALLGAIGTWLFASRFTKSPALRLVVTLGFAVNGRFAEQTAVGHTWHLYYAWTPFALYFLDRAMAMAPAPFSKTKSPLREVILLGVVLAMMVYNGGIYPVPQTICVIAFYAIACAFYARSMRPVYLAVAGGALSFAFAAPRLLPVLEVVRRYPRLVDSPEALDLTGLIGVFTAKEHDRPPVSPWGWHEWGIYTGWIPFLLMIFALFFARRARERALAFAGGFCLLLGMGRFSPYSPWALFHDYLPVFESQHVPSRWLYPATLLLLTCAAAILERSLARVSRRGLLEIALVIVAAYVGLDIGLEAQKPMVGSFVRHLPPLEDSTGPFHQETVAPPGLHYDVSDWAAVAMPPMIANIGVIDCGTFPGLDTYFRDHQGHLPGLGAKGKGDPAYHGETYFATGGGYASIMTWTPNEVVVHYSGAKPGDVLVMNQNWDSGWRANGSAAIDWADLVATRVETADGEVAFRYRPRLFFPGMLLLLSTIAGLVLYARTKKRIAMLEK